MSANGIEVQQQIGHEGANFILRRAVPFLPKPPALEEWREVTRYDDYEKSSTLEDRSRHGGGGVNDSRDLKSWTSSNDIGKTGKDIGHKTVIYFGDSNPRPKEDRARQQQSPSPPPPLPEACLQVTSRSNEDPETSLRSRDGEIEARPRDTSEQDDEREEDSVENSDPKAAHEIVVNVSPSREDVLRIEEDESQLEDYWSLPGDTSGFKADWSFVQQWRLRG